jgi:hypothetical protein
MTDMRGINIIALTLRAAFIGGLLVSGAAMAGAETPDEAQAPASASASKAKPVKQRGLEARHQECLAFIERHGLSCDPWQSPTCGYDIGYARPLSCVAP